MVRKYGLAIDNLLAAQVVTAAGDIVTASAEEHPDLFWAIRVVAGNAGIVTEFVFRLAPVGQILGGELMLPASREVLRGYLDYAAAAPDDLTTIANLMYAPPAPCCAAACWQTGALDPCQLTVTFRLGSGLAPLRALATPIADGAVRADAVPADLPVHGAPSRSARRVDPNDVRR